ncbi:hypothetical protein EWM64_g4928 [Hericium alpestre]|uniref:SAP domain-containing protein n=1 Tax=Hericium alpestre TaxID=135208 RepID=A0A4Z0A047_9AGAM|nr:hypothetical protein EWM64_g4928 [Hericium alpestre]
MSREFPWTSLKADTLRAICRDLGAGGKRKKEEMLEFIQGVERNGLEETLKSVEAEEKETPAKAGAKRARPAKENGAGGGRPSEERTGCGSSS